VSLYIARAVEDGMDDDGRDVALVDDQELVNGEENKRERCEVGTAMCLTWIVGKRCELCEELVFNAQRGVFSGLLDEIGDDLAQIVRG